MKQDIRSLHLPADVTPLDAAVIAIASGALVYPVEFVDGNYEPIRAHAGPGRSGWDLATRDAKEINRLLEANPKSTLGARVRTDLGFDRYYTLKGNAFTEIPAAIYRVGR